MRAVSATDGIIAFARQLAEGSDTCPLTLARDRRWLDEAGRATAEGVAVLAALAEQRGARSVIHHVA